MPVISTLPPFSTPPVPVTEYSQSKINKATQSLTTIHGRGSFGKVYLALQLTCQWCPLSCRCPNHAVPVTEYSLSKIKKATRNFTTIYGRGSFGMVYLAEDFFRDQSDPRAIIKRAHDPQSECYVWCMHACISVQVQGGGAGEGTAPLPHEHVGLGDFLFKCKVEVLARARHRYLVNLLCKVEVLARARHRYLVNLLGYCVGKGERILVYEYLSNGTLFDRLHRPELEPLPWETRVSIAVNIACALEYLHHGVSPPLVHRAVTSSNILLAHDMSAKLSDFGIARGSGGATSSFEENPRRQRKSRAGRAERGEASEASMQMEKVDVYGFGVVLLELITGQKAMKEVHITSVAAPFLEDAQMMPLMVDPQLGGYFNQSELIELGTIARDCVQEDASSRPTMREVLQTMEERLRLDAHLFDNLNEDDALLVDGYSAAVPAAVTASGRRSGVGFGSLRLSVGGGGTSSGRGGESGRWGASVESFAQSIKYVLMSPGRAGSGRGGAGGLPVDDPHDLEMWTEERGIRGEEREVGRGKWEQGRGNGGQGEWPVVGKCGEFCAVDQLMHGDRGIPGGGRGEGNRKGGRGARDGAGGLPGDGVMVARGDEGAVGGEGRGGEGDEGCVGGGGRGGEGERAGMRGERRGDGEGGCAKKRSKCTGEDKRCTQGSAGRGGEEEGERG
ncbi:unnamed protein product [Closterium sp. NIES-64]|nr:unnamed protein product [Closterium sp. NIES-64]